ncbi:hypothetical protein AaE_008060 [Aphanomyces astaci]|uniref:Uncharacterized protein n=1 Tax=Aphanomyces astaci TaxID=112090 RepID=A0A6A5A0X5_APHAT|nr:hypothetical protein AaE_008060 [Aphanomyces astaci]
MLVVYNPDTDTVPWVMIWNAQDQIRHAGTRCKMHKGVCSTPTTIPRRRRGHRRHRFRCPDAALLCLLWFVFGRRSDMSPLENANLTVSAAGVLIVHLMRMMISDELGLSLYYDEKFLVCPLISTATAVVMQSTPHVALLGNLPSFDALVQAEAMSSIPLIDLLNQPTRSGRRVVARGCSGYNE